MGVNKWFMTMTKIAVMIPARNEKENIITTVKGLQKLGIDGNFIIEIVVVDDGSSDNTAEVAEGLNCHVVRRHDRGYSALGKPELADTHNSGFDFIEANIQDYDYIMVVGADTTFEESYIEKLLMVFDQNPNLVMASGIIEGLPTAATTVRGSGRMITRKYWQSIGARLPNVYYSWESYPVFKALSMGFDTMTVYDAISYSAREPLAIVDWKRYGIQMKEIGYLFPYVIARSIGQMRKGKFRRAIRLVYGYIFFKVNKYPVEISSYVRKTQMKRIRRLFPF